MHNKNIYNALQKFSVRGSIPATARPRSLEGTLLETTTA
jgi:hypothetical protein